MTDTTDALIGASVGLIGLGIAAGVANKMMQPQPRYRAPRAKPIRMRPIVKMKPMMRPTMKKQNKVKFMY
jgi:hypothetical protein